MSVGRRSDHDSVRQARLMSLQWVRIALVRNVIRFLRRLKNIIFLRMTLFAKSEIYSDNDEVTVHKTIIK